MIVETLISDYTVRTVLTGAIIMGFVSGSVGSFAYLRRQSLMGDAISHATLPGIAGIFLLTGDRSLWVLLLGAALAGWVAMIVVLELTQQSRIHMDSALGIVLSVFFGLGVVLLTVVNTLPNAGKAGLETYLFGQAALMNQHDVYTIVVLGCVVVLLMVAYWKEFALLSFDEVFARSLGYPVRGLHILITFCIVLAILIGLQAVGVILMSAMIAVPAAAARQWTQRLGSMVLLSGGIGAVASVLGVVVSTYMEHVPTGPAIVLVITGIFVLSLFLAPRRGLLFRWLRMREHRRVIRCRYVANQDVYEY